MELLILHGKGAESANVNINNAGFNPKLCSLGQAKIKVVGLNESAETSTM